MPTHNQRARWVLPQLAAGMICVLGCVGSDLRPRWYVNPEALPDAKGSVVGRGACQAGADVDGASSCAATSARADLVASLRTRIRVAVRLRCERRTNVVQQEREVEKSGTSACELRRQADLTPVEMDVDNLAPIEQGCPGDGYCYALVTASRAELAAQARTRMANQVAQLRGLLGGVDHADTLVALPMIAQAQRLVDALERDADLLHAVTRGRDPWLALLDQPARLRAHWAQRTTLCLEQPPSDRDSQLLVAPILDDLAQAGFGQAHAAAAGDCAGSELTLSLTTGDASTPRRIAAPRRSLWIATQDAVLVLAGAAHHTEKRVEVHGRAVAATRAKARAAAEEDLKQQARVATRALLWGA